MVVGGSDLIMRTALTFAIVSTLAFAAPAAMAQENPPTVETTTTVQTPKVTTKTVTETKSAAAEDDTTDHEKVVGRFAVGYMGVTQLPIASLTQGAGAGTIAAPIIGGRYWLSKFLGIDAGIGLGIGSSSSTAEAGNQSTTTDGPSQLGFALHGGVPLALASGKHMTFEVVPELNVGFAHSGVKGNNSGDISLNGFRLDVGARAGAEIHFGFIGIPELSLQATVGLYVSHLSRSATRDAFGNTGEQKFSASQTTFATSVQNEPWALFVNNVAALYYF